VTDRLYLADPRLGAMRARVLASVPEGVVVDRTVFYARSGGQPGDTGLLRWAGGEARVADTLKGEGEAILHVLAPESAAPPVGAEVAGEIDWERRHRLIGRVGVPIRRALDPVPVDLAVLLDIGQPRDFRVFGVAVFDERMDPRPTEAPAKGGKFGGAEVLVAEHQHRMLGEGALQAHEALDG